MTTKERIIEQLDGLDEGQLEALEAQLDTVTKPSPKEIERRLAAWRGIFGLLSDPEEYTEFEKHAHRRSLSGGRSLELSDKD